MTVASWSISPKGSLFADIKSDNTAQAQSVFSGSVLVPDDLERIHL